LFTLSHIYDLIEYSDSDLMIRYSLFESNWKFTVGQQLPTDDRRANFNFNYGDILMTQLNIKAVNHGTTKADNNGYCGPSAISAITGMTTGEAARLIRLESGQTRVRGTHTNHLLYVLSKCNVRHERRSFGLKLHRRTGPTLAGWLKATVKERTAHRVFLLVAGWHWQLVQGRRYVCGLVGEPVSIKSKKIKRRARVAEVYELWCDQKVVIPPQARKPKNVDPNAKWRRLSKKLAEKLNVRLDVERDVVGWTCWVNAEEIEGNQFCTSWDEVLDRLETVEDIRRGYGFV